MGRYYGCTDTTIIVSTPPLSRSRGSNISKLAVSGVSDFALTKGGMPLILERGGVKMISADEYIKKGKSSISIFYSSKCSRK